MLHVTRVTPARWFRILQPRYYSTAYSALLPGKFLHAIQTTTQLQDMLQKIDDNKKKCITFLQCLSKACLIRVGIEQQHAIQKSSWLNWFRIRFGYTSNALEGNSLTEGDVMYLVENGVTVGGKPLQDFMDVVAHDNAVKMMFNIASSETALTVDLVKSLHAVALPAPVRESDPPLGQYKKTPNMTFTTATTGKYVVQRYVDPEDVRDRVAELVFWLRDNEKEVHPVQLAAVSHYNLATIHPFPDGNGRVARLLMNVMLLRNSFIPAIIEFNQRDAYIAAIQTARETQNLTPFMEFITQTMLATQEGFLQLGTFVCSK